MIKIQSNEDLEEFIRRFELQSIPVEEWHHDEHIIMAYYYLSTLPHEEAINRITDGIQKLTDALGVKQTKESGYHHTWTIFFSKIIQKRMAQAEFKNLKTLQEKLDDLTQHLKDFKGISRQYYSKDLILSWDARKNWVEPDLRERDF